MDTTQFIKKTLGFETVEPALTPPTGKAHTFIKKPQDRL